MRELLFFDSTLRDGSHAIKHQLTEEQIGKYCRSMDRTGMHTIIVGHGNGLGASSLQVGQSLLTDEKMLTVAHMELQHTKLGAYMIPGFGTIRDDILPALERGVELFCIGCHCTEANTTRQHIEYVRDKGKEVYGILMMYHMASTDRLLEEALKMESYGAKGVILMDSAGASTPELVKRTISTLVKGMSIRIGFHAHNNLGLAVGNSYLAYQEGASILDGTLRGFGAGAGNCPLEVLAALMQKEGVETGLDLYRMLDVSDGLIPQISGSDKGLSQINVISGMTGVFSAFAPHVINAAERFGVDARDIFMELGKRKAVAGQEDMIIEVAINLQKQKLENQNLSF